MIFDSELLDSLTAQAKLNERHRQHYDLRDSVNDNFQKMLNAIEPESVLTIHKHPKTAKLIVLVRGSVRMNLYDNDGNVIKQTVLRPDGETFYVVPQDAWHNLTCLESGSVIYIQKNCKFDPEKDTLHFDRQVELDSNSALLKNPFYNAAITFIESNDLNSLPVGTTEIDGKNLWVNIVETELKPLSAAKFEAHNNYIDIQIPLSAAEQFGVKERNFCTQPIGIFNDDQDYILFNDPINDIKSVAPGEMIVFAPNIAHAPLIGNGNIRKAIFKVRVQ